MINERLLDTAIDHFGRHGFDGASTRAIAAASDTVMSSITYHYGGKQGLYLAAARHIAEQIGQLHAARLEQIDALDDPGGPAGLTALMELIDGFATIMLAPQSAPWARFVARELQDPTEAFDLLFDKAIRGNLGAADRLLRALRPEMDDRQRRATIILLFAQPLILRMGRATVCRVLDDPDLGSASQELLRAQLRHNIIAIVDPKGQHA